jgi:hypothetical protein
MISDLQSGGAAPLSRPVVLSGSWLAWAVWAIPGLGRTLSQSFAGFEEGTGMVKWDKMLSGACNASWRCFEM